MTINEKKLEQTNYKAHLYFEEPFNPYLRDLKERILASDDYGLLEREMVHKTCYERFEEVAHVYPNKIALNYFGTKFTFSQALQKIDCYAAGFQKLGCKENDVVACCFLGCLDGIFTFYALDKLGVSMHMVNITTGLDEIKRELNNIPSKMFVGNDILLSEDVIKIIKETGNTNIIVDSLTNYIPIPSSKTLFYYLAEMKKGLPKKIYQQYDILTFSQLIQIGSNNDKPISCIPYNEKHIAAYCYTSGTTNVPKACAQSWKSIDSHAHVTGLTEESRFKLNYVIFSCYPLWISFSLFSMYHEPLCYGCSLAFDPLFIPKNFPKREKLYGFTMWMTMPSHAEAISKCKGKADYGKLKIIITGGGPLSIQQKEACDNYINGHNGNVYTVQGIGHTELIASIAYQHNDNPTTGTCGVPMIGTQVKLIDPDCIENLPRNKEGYRCIDFTKIQEVEIGQPGLSIEYTPARMEYYYGNEKDTKDSFLVDNHNLVWYVPGDILKRNEKGELIFVERQDRISLILDDKNNPAKIAPAEVNTKLLSIPFIEDCETILVEDPEIINKPIAVIKLKPGKENNNETIEQIKNYCEEQMAHYKIPRQFIFVTDIPKVTSGKHDLAAVKEICKQQQ